MKSILSWGAGVMVMAGSAALAFDLPPKPTSKPTSVPEIDPASGMAAIALLLCAAFIIREALRRRARAS